MTGGQDQRAEKLFKAAFEIDARDRIAWLERACAGDQALRETVESMLAADEGMGSFLECPTEVAAGAEQGPDARVGTRIGHYRLAQVIGSGGMGTVYEAEQDQPKRRVALKLLRSGLASQSALRRFVHEADILARLRHPGIAQIHEAGFHGEGDGTPYFAMEYIPGAQPITVYAKDHSLSTHQRLDLFMAVCAAVQHGHRRGVIHRDLKPGNILVDESGQPKVIDFGVARVTDADMSIATRQTDVGQLVGTLRYMSPEQCDGDAIELDTRSDVYALGVVLFELLTGELPYEFTTSSPFDVPRIIREQEPRRLSRFDRTLRGDLETIVLKTLEKERSRRYESVGALVQDIRRYLNDEPVEARRATGWYVLRKSLRRHRAAAVVAGAVFVLLSVSSVSMALMYRRAETEADASRQVVRVLQTTLTEASPYHSESGKALRPLLDDTARQICAGFIEQPRVRAAIQGTLGSAYMNLGDHETGGEHLQAALATHRALLGEDHPETAVSKSRLAVWRFTRGELDEAEALLRQAIATLQDHQKTHLFDLGRSWGRLAHALFAQGRLDEADSAAHEFLQIARALDNGKGAETATALNLLSNIVQEQGKLADAEPLLREALEIDRAYYGDEHQRAARDLSNLGILLRKLGNLDAAEDCQRRVLAIQRRANPDNLVVIAGALGNLANTLVDKGQRAAAAELFRESLALYEQSFGARHPWVADSCLNLANCLVIDGAQNPDAQAFAQRAAEIGEQTLPAGHPRTAMYHAMNGQCLLGLGRWGEAEAEMLKGYEGLEAAFGSGDPRTQEAISGLCELYRQWGDSEKAARFGALLSEPPAP